MMNDVHSVRERWQCFAFASAWQQQFRRPCPYFANINQTKFNKITVFFSFQSVFSLLVAESFCAACFRGLLWFERLQQFLIAEIRSIPHIRAGASTAILIIFLPASHAPGRFSGRLQQTATTTGDLGRVLIKSCLKNTIAQPRVQGPKVATSRNVF
jgi:hypothetical protein